MSDPLQQTRSLAESHDPDFEDDLFAECLACDGDGVEWNGFPCASCGGTGYQVPMEQDHAR